jgi:hypothetical protein
VSLANVAGALHTLTVQASDGTATSTVTVTNRYRPCAENPGLVGDCLLLLENRGAWEASEAYEFDHNPVGRCLGQKRPPRPRGALRLPRCGCYAFVAR